MTTGQWSIAASQLHLTRAFVALDVPEAGDPEALLKMSYAGAPRGGFHSRLPVLYCAFPRARAGDVPSVAGAIDEAFELSVAHGMAVAYADVSIAAAELFENLGRLDDAAAIIAALYRQAFTSHMQYHRYRRVRSRLPSAPTPNRQLTVPELHSIVRTRLANLTGEPATTDTRTDADSQGLPRS